MPTYKNLRAGALQLDQRVKRNDKGEIVAREPQRLIPPGAEFNADESEVPRSWLGTDTHPKFIELVSRTEKKVLASALDNDVPPPQQVDEGAPKTDALVPETKPPVDSVGRTGPLAHSPSAEVIAENARAEADAAKEQTDKVAKPSSTHQKADKPAK